MKLFCKELKGNEIEINDVSEETQISSIKSQIERKLNIPVLQQKLIFVGKILQDDNRISDYSIKDGAKLMLTRVPKPDLKKLIYQHMLRFYDTEAATGLSNLFIENMKNRLQDYSLDDLDRLAEASFINESM